MTKAGSTGGSARRWLRDPLVHFLGIGLLLFGLYGLVAPAAGTGETVRITRSTVADLAARHEKLWGRPPSAEDLQRLIDAQVHDEILYREGLAMGLDRDDAVIKRRVRQKYELIAEEAGSAAPTDADLAAYLKANAPRFRAPPVVSFTQVLVPPGANGEALRAALGQGADPAQAGEATLLPARVEAMGLDLVARDFGADFAGGLADMPTGQWLGPVASAYGRHIVRIDRRVPATDPPLSAVRAEVQREWENSRREATAAARYADLRAKYDVVIEGAAAR